MNSHNTNRHLAPTANRQLATDPITVWTADRIRALGAVTDLTTAAAIFDLSRTLAYDLAQHGRFSVPVICAGTRYRVPVAAILTALHIPDAGLPPST